MGVWLKQFGGNYMICKLATEDDIFSIINIIKSVFGDNYWHKDMYKPQYIKKTILSGDCIIILAMFDGVAVGMMTAEKDKIFKGTLLLRSLMTIKDKRFDGSAQMVHDYFFANFDASAYTSIYLCPVTGHTVSQHISEKYGFTVCGALMNGYIGEKSYFILDQSKPLTLKRTNLISVKKSNLLFVGDIFVPPDIAGAVRMIYSSLKTPCRVIDKTFGFRDEFYLNAKSIIDIADSPDRFNTNIIVRMPCKDCYKKINDIINSTSNHPLQTFQIFINAKHTFAINVITELTENGFCFTGIKPLGLGEEFVILYFSHCMSLSLSGCELTEKSAEILQEIFKEANN